MGLGMTVSAIDLRAGPRNHIYRRFLTQVFQLKEPEWKPFDPFVLNVVREEPYLLRRDIEDQISQPVSQFILGKDGSGKSTLYRRLQAPASQPSAARTDRQGAPRQLIVAISLTQLNLFVNRERMMSGVESVLSLTPLTRAIFDAYWNVLIFDRQQYNRLFRLLRTDRGWMTTLRNFYRRFPPARMQVTDDFELMAWLNCTAAADQGFDVEIRPETLLSSLLDFVHQKVNTYGKPLHPFSAVEVLIDGTERLSGPAVLKLLDDAETICDYYSDRLTLKLFLEFTENHVDQVRAMHCVKRGGAQLTYVPPWSEEELAELLRERLSVLPGEFKPTTLGESLPASAIEPATRRNLDTLIAKGAHRVYLQHAEDPEDAPVHLLRIARGVFAACAGCWPDEFAPPISTNHVNSIINLYWNPS